MLGALVIFAFSTIAASALPMPYYGYPYSYGYGYYGGYYGYPFVYPSYYYRQPYLPAAPTYSPSKMVYHGTLTGDCSSVDGLFYVDKYNFAFCSNGQKTVQPCAAGSANPPLESFETGTYYDIYEFCSENLVAKGYFQMAPQYNEMNIVPEIYAKEAVDASVEEEMSPMEIEGSYESLEEKEGERVGYTEEVHAWQPAQ